jgi:hypothetical protein
MDAQFASRLTALIAASGGQISIGSGYRSVERQAQLFAQAVKKYGSPEKARRWVAPPGKSNHGRGVAADLKFNTPQAKALAHRLAPQFGLIFPMDYEPWHIEPVGAREGAAPEAYKIPTNGSLHPQDPAWKNNNAAYTAAALAEALSRPDETGELGTVLEGGFTGEVAVDDDKSGVTPVTPVTGSDDAESWIRTAMQVAGVGEDWYPGLRARMLQESGGRNIAQKVVDVNTRKGTPAFGPMQVIEPTFNAHAVEGYKDWRNPVDNTIAAIRYIQGRYGHPSKLPKGGY